MLTVKPGEIPIPKLHEYLLAAVAPRPIAFVSTVDKDGTVNLAPFSFFNVFGSNPPTLIYSPARSGRTKQTKHTHDNVVAVPECVVNIAHYDMLYQMNLAAHMYEKGVNEFAKSGLTPVASEMVTPPRVGEAFVQMECKVKQVIETGTEGSAGNLIICEVLLMHINEKVLNEEGSIDPFKMNYIARLSKQFWCRVGEENIITIPPFKMHNEVGLGFDQLPKGILHSKYLSGNDIAQIAAQQHFPAPEEMEELKKSTFLKNIVEGSNGNFERFEKQVHLAAKNEIIRGSHSLAFQLLMVVEELRNKWH